MRTRLLTASIVCAAVAACSGSDTTDHPNHKRTVRSSGAAATVENDGPLTVQLKLTAAPAVPPPIKRHRAAHVVVHIEVKEVVAPIAGGTTYTFWTFGGHVPGPFVRVREGDTVELHLANSPDDKMPHNIDLHAVTGPGGGAPRTFVAPGHESQFTFTALRSGLYVYHCAAAPVGLHIANGMYGMILVEPQEGLPPVDREYYVMQGDFYTQGEYHAKGLQTFDIQKAIDERPTYVLFNGAEGALTGPNALKAVTGDRIRLFVGNGGPNMVSSFHVIGEIFDRVYREGGATFDTDVQTTLIPAGGAAIVEFTAQVPGQYSIVDHSIFRAFNKGAVAELDVEGPPNDSVYASRTIDRPFSARDEEATAKVFAHASSKEDRIAAGKAVFEHTCIGCHQDTGLGMPPSIPPLAGSDFLMADKARSISIVLHGLKGPVTVNGQTFSRAEMPSHAFLSDDDIADVLTFVRNSWGNQGETVTADEVAKQRDEAAPTRLGMN